MYKPKNNFLSYYTPSAEIKKADAKKILANLLEGLGVEELNKLYSATEVTPIQTKAPSENTSASIEPKAVSQEPKEVKEVKDPVDLASLILKQDPADPKKLIVQLDGTEDKQAQKQQYTVVFNKAVEATPIAEEIRRRKLMSDPCESIEDEYEESETTEEEDKEHIKESDKLEASKEDASEATEDVLCSGDYDPLESAPPLQLKSDESNGFEDMIDAIKQHSGGMMSSVQIAPNMLRPKSKSAVGPSKRDAIRSIEEDPYGLSVVGLDNDIGMNLLN